MSLFYVLYKLPRPHPLGSSSLPVRGQVGTSHFPLTPPHFKPSINTLRVFVRPQQLSGDNKVCVFSLSSQAEWVFMVNKLSSGLLTKVVRQSTLINNAQSSSICIEVPQLVGLVFNQRTYWPRRKQSLFVLFALNLDYWLWNGSFPSHFIDETLVFKHRWPIIRN